MHGMMQRIDRTELANKAIGSCHEKPVWRRSSEFGLFAGPPAPVHWLKVNREILASSRSSF